jgi:hypothetical protein
MIRAITLFLGAAGAYAAMSVLDQSALHEDFVAAVFLALLLAWGALVRKGGERD